MPITLSNKNKASDFLKNYNGGATSFQYSLFDGTRGWGISGTNQKALLVALIYMSSDPTVANKPFTHVPRRKHITIADIKSAEWWEILKQGEYSDRPWLYSGEYTDSKGLYHVAPSSKKVLCFEGARIKAPKDPNATQQKFSYFKEKQDETLLQLQDSLYQTIKIASELTDPKYSKLKDSLISVNSHLASLLEQV